MTPPRPDLDLRDKLKPPAGVVVSVACWAGLLSLAGQMPELVFGALLTGAGAVTAWFCGWRLALALIVIGAVLRNGSVSVRDAAQLPWLIATCGIAAGFAVWTGVLRRRFDQEQRRARWDGLTGLPNREAFLERCAAELSRAKRFDRPVSFAMLDGDQFKQVNDRRGHAAGDAALRETARALSQAVRHYDFVARWGGDEFVILFPETGPDDAQAILRRLDQALGAAIESSFHPLTFCIGAVTVFPVDSWDVAKCLAEADRVLYAAKRAGGKSLRHETPGRDPLPPAPVPRPRI